MLRAWCLPSGMCRCVRIQKLHANCRGQCYNGASNMSGARKGVAAQEESCALYTHCYGHTINLAVFDTMKQSKVCRDLLDTAFEITRLITFSPKRSAAFDQIKSSNEDDCYPSPIEIHTFCPTWWRVRGNDIESILVNFSTPLAFFGRSACSPQPVLILM